MSLPGPGDHVWIRQQRWRIERVRREYDVVRYDVVTRDRHATFLAPFDRPVWKRGHGRLRYAAPRQAQARLAGLLGQAFGYRTVASLASADAAILAHQLEPACALIDGARRILIADDVGLGKTIQAGIIIAETIRREPAPRVLVIAPASLTEQWSDELGRRFGVACVRADRAELDARSRLGAPGENPWTRSGVWIASLDYLKQPHVLAALPPGPWDLVVVDEAHTACGDSDRHAACCAVTSAARRVVLLTATPHDGDAARFARLLALGELTNVDDPLTVFRRTRRDVHRHADRRVRWQRVRLSYEERRLLETLASYEQAVLRAAGTPRRDAALLLLSVLRKRSLSTMGALAASLRRRLEWLERRQASAVAEPIQRALAFDDSDEVAPDETSGLTAEIGLDPRHERAWIRRLVDLAARAARRESKAARVVAFVRRIREPVIVFTEFRDSLRVLLRRIGAVVPFAALHGGQSPAERRGELARFLNGSASVLIATDVASLGLNLQTRARAVVNLELPWNPVRLEQRAGRVDRIGQTRGIHVTLVVARHAAESPVIIRLAARTLAARGAIGDVPGSFIGEAAVRESVLADALVPPAVSAPPWSPSSRFVRRGRTAARALVRRRNLRRQWQAPSEDGRGARWTFATRARPVPAVAESTTLFFAVPVIDAAGTVVESHAVGVRVFHQPSANRCSAGVVESATRLAAQALERRARRLARRLQRRCDLEAARELAIAAHVTGVRRPAEAQPGLFDRRECRAFDASRREVETLRDAADRHLLRLRQASAVDVGQPVLVLMFVWRP